MLLSQYPTLLSTKRLLRSVTRGAQEARYYCRGKGLAPELPPSPLLFLPCRRVLQVPNKPRQVPQSFDAHIFAGPFQVPVPMSGGPSNVPLRLMDQTVRLGLTHRSESAHPTLVLDMRKESTLWPGVEVRHQLIACW